MFAAIALLGCAYITDDIGLAREDQAVDDANAPGDTLATEETAAEATGEAGDPSEDAETTDSPEDDSEDDSEDDTDSSEDTGPGPTWYLDADGDGFGDPWNTTNETPRPKGYVNDATDCDDANEQAHPGATEWCDDLWTDCSVPWEGDVGLATFRPTGGDPVDYTATLAAGSAATPTTVELRYDGALTICEGTWFTDLEVTATDLSITGLHGAGVTILDGSESHRLIGILTDGARVEVQGLTLTRGFACRGGAIGVLLETGSCGSDFEAWDTEEVVLTLRDVVVTDNRVDAAGAAIWIDEGSLTLEHTTISLNDGSGVGAWDSSVTCVGSPTTSEGVWGNEGDGIFHYILNSSSGKLLTSTSCDFDGLLENGDHDVNMGSIATGFVHLDKGNDASFTCDAALGTCW